MHTVILKSYAQRAAAVKLIEKAPEGFVVTVAPPRRTNDQNALMWSLLSDISRAKPEGRTHTPESWKCLFLHALGHAARFEIGLDGAPFPVGFRSSHLSKAQMSDLVEFIREYGARHGVKFSDEGE